MAQISETRNSKSENRNSNAFLLWAGKRRSRLDACPHEAPPRGSSFEFRISIRAAFRLLSAFSCLHFAVACGYHVAGQATRIPPDVKLIGIPAFKNQSTTFHIEQQTTAAVTREFLQRTRFRILPKETDVDAVLKGTIKDVRARAITFDNNTGLATSLQVTVTTDVKLEDMHSHRLLFANSNYIYREEYQVSETPSALFEEDKPALERLSRDLARTLVTDILENF